MPSARFWHRHCAGSHRAQQALAPGCPWLPNAFSSLLAPPLCWQPPCPTSLGSWMRLWALRWRQPASPMSLHTKNGGQLRHLRLPLGCIRLAWFTYLGMQHTLCSSVAWMEGRYFSRGTLFAYGTATTARFLLDAPLAVSGVATRFRSPVQARRPRGCSAAQFYVWCLL